jgi:DNA-binding response OmpR family regulator
MAPKIVISDSDPQMLALFDEILSSAGYNTDLYLYGLPDLDTLRRMAPSAIITNYWCSIEDSGQQLWSQILDEGETWHIPVILCTGAYRDLWSKSGWWQHPGVYVMRKPFDIDDLVAVLEYLAPRPAHAQAAIPN